MVNTRGLLYPALHKFYSSLSSLEKFEKGTNFFDSISYLDNFFSEYRNITFVLQKSLAHTEFTSAYETLRDKYLINDVGRWFIEKRNSVLKQQPFNLEKRIIITIYSGQETVELPELVFTIDNDMKYSSIIESLRKKLFEISPLEVMFSAEFFFYESGYTQDLYDNFIFGINQMKFFISAMKKIINEECKLCDALESKIESMNYYRVPKDMLFVDDYIFYCKRNYFEKASRVALTLGGGQSRSSIENLSKFYPDGDTFTKFVFMHVMMYQMQKTLLPTCFVVYEDETFELLTFGFSIKTTVYRKFNEISKRIRPDKIASVLFVNEMYTFNESQIKNMDSRERIKHARNENLTFFMVDKNLANKALSFETKRIDDFEYLASVIFSKPSRDTLPGFMNPVIREFAKLHEQANE